MKQHVDLTNLRSMTEGDTSMEKELFEAFIDSFEAGITSLQANSAGNAAEAWRKQAHALKGIALNMGAEKLSELCKEGQDNPLASPDAKQQLVEKIRAEYAHVRQFLLTTINAA